MKRYRPVLKENKYKEVKFKGDDTKYYVIDSFKDRGKDYYEVVIDEKIMAFEKYKNTPKRELYSEIIPQDEFENY